MTIGSTLAGNGDDNLPSYCVSGGTCTGTNLSLPAANTAPGGLTSPIDGVAVQWRVKSGSAGNPVSLRVLRPAGGADYTGAGTSTQGTTSAGTSQFSSQVSIKTGDSIGLDIGNSALVWSNNGGANGLVWGSANGFPNGLADGTTGTGAAPGGKELLVQAVIEPDADADGLGDETQDPCPTQPGPVCTGDGGGDGGGGGAVDDTTPPEVSGARVKPKRFQVARKAGTRYARAKTPPTGTTFLFTLSEPATVTALIERVLPGRRVRGKCRRPTEANRRRPRCARYKRIGKLTYAGATGANAQPFTGRLDGRTLRPGRHQVTLTGADGASNVSAEATAGFRVVKPR